MIRTAVLAALITGPAFADACAIQDFLVREACAVGPSVLDRAAEAGIDRAELQAIADEHLREGTAIRQGDWIVLSSEVCQIAPPDLFGAIQMADPEVAAATIRLPANLETGAPERCYLLVDHLKAGLRERRGWTEDEFTIAYLQFVAAGFASGDLRFYSHDILTTPVALSVSYSDRCKQAAGQLELDDSRAFFVENLDRIFRDAGAALSCAKASRTLFAREPLERWMEEGNTNAQLGFEMQIIAMGAGWFDGVDVLRGERGIPRPPLCTVP